MNTHSELSRTYNNPSAAQSVADVAVLLYMTLQMNADECPQFPVFMRLCLLNMRNYL